MKKLNILSVAFLGLAAMFTSCDKDGENVMLKETLTAPAIKNITAGQSVVLTDATKADAFYVVWSETDFGVPVSANYEVQIMKKGGDFTKDAKSLGVVNNNDTLKITKGALNNVLLAMQADPEAPVATQVEMRVVASVSSSVAKLVSPVVSITVTPYEEIVIYPNLFVPGNYVEASGYTGGNWSPATAPKVVSAKSNGIYEGYIYFASAAMFKFTANPNWDGPNYGDGGAGKISATGGDISIATPGYYQIVVNVPELKWSYLKTDWGVVGSATGSWDVDQNMTYNPTTKVWTATLDLVVGEIKFRANDAWALDYGGANGKLVQGGANIQVATAGNYTITVDFSNAPKYTYKLVKN